MTKNSTKEGIETRKKRLKSGLNGLIVDSNPTLSASNASNFERIDGFFEDYKQLWQQTVADTYPYKPARLIHHDYDLTKRWYVIFYAWDVTDGKLKRKRLFDPMNREKTVRRRLEVGDQIVKLVNSDLRAGKVFGKEKVNKEVSVNIFKMTLTQGIKHVASEKEMTGHRENYYRGFNALITNVNEWLAHEDREDFLMKNLKQSDLFSFFRYLNQTKKLSNKSYNNYRNYLSTAINFLMKREPRLFKSNPTVVIDSLPVIVKKHAAFTDDQMIMIRNECIKLGLPQVLLFIQFVYYTLSRPLELMQLQVQHIDLQQKRLFVPGEASKTKFDEYIGLTEYFKKTLLEYGMDKYPKHYYIFGNEGVPSAKAWASSNYFWRRNVKILKRLDFYSMNKNYSMYSYKHSGAISLYLATKDIKLVQRQCRHKTINQTNEYLRDLGLIGGYEGINDWKGSV